MWIAQKGRELPPSELLDPATTALVVIDVQNDFCHPDGAFGKIGADNSRMPPMATRIRELLAAARERQVFTVFVRAIYDEEVTSAALAQNRRRLGLLNSLCLEGSWGADWYGDVAPAELPHEVVVTKHRFDAFHGTPLDLYLRSNGIRNVVVTGVATSGCVESTVRDAFFLDYYVVVASDAVGEGSKERHDSSLNVMERAFAKIMPVAEIAQTWRGANTGARGWMAESKQTLAAEEPSRAALVLVNLQAGRDAAELRDALPGIRRLLDAARAGGTPVFHVRSQALPLTSSPALLRRAPGAAAAGVAPFLSGFEPQGRELVVDKYRASAMTDGRLAQLLRTHLVGRVVLAGTTALDDIDATARDALDRDLRVTVVPDAVGFTAQERTLQSNWQQVAAARGCDVHGVDRVASGWAR
jgi:ureidoacrylate peracid hydrolase